METGLDCLRPGAKAVVARVDTEPGLKQRLRDFGLVPGTVVHCRYRCPWGHLTALEVRGSVLAVRTHALRKVRVML